MVVGLGGEGAFEEGVLDWDALGDLAEHVVEALDGGDFGEGLAEDLFGGQADDLGLAIIEAEISKFDGIEESQADGGGFVDGLKLGGLALEKLFASFGFSAGADLFGDIDGEDEDAVDDAGGVGGRLVDEVEA
jgi:hypothetical protein